MASVPFVTCTGLRERVLALAPTAAMSESWQPSAVLAERPSCGTMRVELLDRTKGHTRLELANEGLFGTLPIRPSETAIQTAPDQAFKGGDGGI
ncbi:hypothetical protein GCM10009739_24780 [Microbacterium ulmi]